MDSSTDFLAGLSVHSLRTAYSELCLPPASNSCSPSSLEAFLESSKSLEARMGLRVRMSGYWPLAEFWEDKIKKDKELVDNFVDAFVEDALNKMGEKKDEETLTAHKTLLDYLVEADAGMFHCLYIYMWACFMVPTRQVPNQGRDPQCLVCGQRYGKRNNKHVLHEQFSLARNSLKTSRTLTFIIYLLTQHQDVFSRARNEVLEMFGKTAEPTYEGVKELKLVHAIING